MKQNLTFMMCKHIFYIYFLNFQWKEVLQGAVVRLIKLEPEAPQSREVLELHCMTWMVLAALQKQRCKGII